MPNFSFSSHSHCSSAQTMSRGKCRHNLFLGDSPDKSAGGSRRLHCGGTTGSPFEASPSISQTPYRASRYCAESSNPPRPGRCTFEALISDAYHFSRFTVSVVLRRLRLYCFGDPATQPPRGLSPGACARVAPRVSRVPRLNQSDALGPRPTKSHARRFATGTQSCAALPGTLSFAANSKRVKRELETGQTQNLKIQA